MINKVSQGLRLLAKPLLLNIPFFLWSLLLQCPLLISWLHNAPLKALYMFFNIGDGATSDLYFVIILSIVIVYVCYIVSKMTIVGGRFLKILIYVLLILTFITRKFLMSEFGLQLTPSTFSLLQETNNHEVSGFIGDYLLSAIGFKYFMIALGLSFVVGLSDWVYNKKNLQHKLAFMSKGLGTLVVISILIGIPAIIGGYNQLMAAPGGQSTFSAIHCTLLKMSKTSEESSGFWNTIDKVSSKVNVVSCHEDSLNVIFVLGESFIKSHSSLYGYSLKTMPYMEKELEKGNLFVFKDVVSPFNGTSNAMKNLFCLNDLAKNEKWFHYTFWPQLFKKAGFSLYLWDNQKNFDKKHGNTFYEMYSHRVSKLCYDEMNENVFDFDEYIVDDFAKRINITKRAKNFVWFHLMGQHFAFADKCPEDKKIFKAKDIKRSDSFLTSDMKQVIADYDNAVYYNDYVLEKIIGLFRNTNSVVVFISDHGEETYDYRAKASRPAMEIGKEKEYAHCQHDVPLLIWCSNMYIQKHPDIVRALSKSLNNPSMTDKIGYTLLNLANIESPFYKSDKDVTSVNFRKNKRFIYLMGGEKFDYDRLK